MNAGDPAGNDSAASGSGSGWHIEEIGPASKDESGPALQHMFSGTSVNGAWKHKASAPAAVGERPESSSSRVAKMLRRMESMGPSSGRRSSFDDEVSAMVTRSSLQQIDADANGGLTGNLNERRGNTMCHTHSLSSQNRRGTGGRFSQVKSGDFKKFSSEMTVGHSASLFSTVSLRRVVRPVVSKQNAMEVHTSDTFAKALPFIGLAVDRWAFRLSRMRLFQAGLLAMWFVGFVGGVAGLCRALGENDLSDSFVFLSVLMIPGEVFPILLFNKRITTSLLSHFETWFVMINMLVPIVVLCVMVGPTRMVFVIASAPGLVSIPFMDAYPAFMRTKVVKAYFVLNMAYWIFWFWVLHFGYFIELRDEKLYAVGYQDHYSGEVCAGCISNLLCFGLRNVVTASRHPEWFAVLSTPLETIKLCVSRPEPRIAVEEEKLASEASLHSVKSEGSPTGQQGAAISVISENTGQDSDSDSDEEAEKTVLSEKNLMSEKDIALNHQKSVNSEKSNKSKAKTPVAPSTENDGQEVEEELEVVLERTANHEDELRKELERVRGKRVLLEKHLPSNAPWFKKRAAAQAALAKPAYRRSGSAGSGSRSSNSPKPEDNGGMLGSRRGSAPWSFGIKKVESATSSGGGSPRGPVPSLPKGNSDCYLGRDTEGENSPSSRRTMPWGLPIKAKGKKDGPSGSSSNLALPTQSLLSRCTSATTLFSGSGRKASFSIGGRAGPTADNSDFQMGPTHGGSPSGLHPLRPGMLKKSETSDGIGEITPNGSQARRGSALAGWLDTAKAGHWPWKSPQGQTSSTPVFPNQQGHNAREENPAKPPSEGGGNLATNVQNIITNATSPDEIPAGSLALQIPAAHAATVDLPSSVGSHEIEELEAQAVADHSMARK